MANREGGGGGFGWLVLGVILGVVGTLALQLFAKRPDADEAEAPPAHTLAIAPAPPVAAAPPHRVKAAAHRLAPSAAPTPADAAAADTGQIAEDAAAAGMTSRSAN